jgi:hypothetical protein
MQTYTINMRGRELPFPKLFMNWTDTTAYSKYRNARVTRSKAKRKKSKK